MPSFLAQADALRAKGVDQIACVSVNDAFVMKKWGEDTSATGTIDMLADGNGEFARATGLTLDGTGFGLGERTTRFSMIVDDGTVTVLNVEENPAEMDVSSAEHMLSAALIPPALRAAPAKGACAPARAHHIVRQRRPHGARGAARPRFGMAAGPLPRPARGSSGGDIRRWR